MAVAVDIVWPIAVLVWYILRCKLISVCRQKLVHVFFSLKLFESLFGAIAERGERERKWKIDKRKVVYAKIKFSAICEKKKANGKERISYTSLRAINVHLKTTKTLHKDKLHELECCSWICSQIVNLKTGGEREREKRNKDN